LAAHVDAAKVREYLAMARGRGVDVVCFADATYDKTHLFPGEERYYMPGNQFVQFDIRGGPIYSCAPTGDVNTVLKPAVRWTTQQPGNERRPGFAAIAGADEFLAPAGLGDLTWPIGIIFAGTNRKKRVISKR
jgi:hypothetical protein